MTTLSIGTMSHRQLEVAQFVADGLSNKQIARRLGISARRVHAHVTALAFLAGVDPQKNTRVQLALWWTQKAS